MKLEYIHHMRLEAFRKRIRLKELKLTNDQLKELWFDLKERYPYKNEKQETLTHRGYVDFIKDCQTKCVFVIGVRIKCRNVLKVLPATRNTIHAPLPAHWPDSTMNNLKIHFVSELRGDKFLIEADGYGYEMYNGGTYTPVRIDRQGYIHYLN